MDSENLDVRVWGPLKWENAQAIGYSYHLKEQLQVLNPTCGGRAEGQDVQETQLQNRLPGSG